MERQGWIEGFPESGIKSNKSSSSMFIVEVLEEVIAGRHGLYQAQYERFDLPCTGERI